ncbi:putative G-protein coupled receptor 174 [Willisornis vidua]|uniref:G-protein coupled receptor 174 n=2 Tax=Thamnophilidae TaxID=81887 RepID=A0ABQ9DEH5_9PASS|nr:putative G-protein coupled receptor 174 [Willisornis vidua]
MTNSSNCSDPDLKPYYAVTYAVILVPGLVANTLALWVFYGYMKETKRAVIFMINLAIADLLQVLSLPLRIFYYVTGTWEFGGGLCLLCFYLKYVNMYASIFFLVCISVRRCLFLIHPFRAGECRRVCDVSVSVAGWAVVCVACLPFPLLRLHKDDTNTCFVDLPIEKLDLPTSVTLMTMGELVGFVMPLLIILYCSWKTILSLKEKNSASHDLGEKKKALKMILTCALVFLICFAPYHISFPLDFFVKTGQIRGGCVQRVISVFHAVALCLASLNSCVDPVIYYFTTDEFRRRLSRQDLHDSLQLQHLSYSRKHSRDVLMEDTTE